MFQPLVSVVIPVYNGEKYIEKTIQSILMQDYENFEIILINDGSSDNSSKLITELSEKEVKIKVFHTKNGGVASARNYGINQSSGTLIAFCDQDDLWFPTKLTKQVPLFDDDKVGLVYCGAHAVNEIEKITRKPGFEKKKKGQVFAELVKSNMLMCCTAIVRKSVLDTVGGFDDDRSLMGVDDWHLWLKVAMIYDFDYVAEYLCAHVFHGNNYSLNDVKMHQAELVCLDKIKPLAKNNSLQVDWDAIKLALSQRYAQSYIYSGDYSSAAQAYKDCYALKPDLLLLFKSLLFKWTPAVIFQTLQKIKRAKIFND